MPTKFFVLPNKNLPKLINKIITQLTNYKKLAAGTGRGAGDYDHVTKFCWARNGKKSHDRQLYTRRIPAAGGEIF